MSFWTIALEIAITTAVIVASALAEGDDDD